MEFLDEIPKPKSTLLSWLSTAIVVAIYCAEPPCGDMGCYASGMYVLLVELPLALIQLLIFTPIAFWGSWRLLRPFWFHKVVFILFVTLPAVISLSILLQKQWR